jgi:rod shape-determining protein MreD
MADKTWRFSISFIFMLGLLVLNISALSYPLASIAQAPLFLASIYYWAVYRPTMVPAWFVFVCGIFLDVMSGNPVGLHGLIFVATQSFVKDQRRFLTTQPFFIIWLGFCLISILNAIFYSLVYWLFNGVILGVPNIFFSAVLGIILFPAVSIIMHFAHKFIPDDLRFV